MKISSQHSFFFYIKSIKVIYTAWKWRAILDELLLFKFFMFWWTLWIVWSVPLIRTQLESSRPEVLGYSCPLDLSQTRTGDAWLVVLKEPGYCTQARRNVVAGMYCATRASTPTIPPSPLQNRLLWSMRLPIHIITMAARRTAVWLCWRYWGY